MPRKLLDHEENPHANLRRLPQRAVFALWGCLREFEGLEARGQVNRGIKSVASFYLHEGILIFLIRNRGKFYTYQEHGVTVSLD